MLKQLAHVSTETCLLPDMVMTVEQTEQDLYSNAEDTDPTGLSK